MNDLEQAAVAKLRYGFMPTPAEARVLERLAEGFEDFAAFGKWVQDMSPSEYADWIAGGARRAGGSDAK